MTGDEELERLRVLLRQMFAKQTFVIDEIYEEIERTQRIDENTPLCLEFKSNKEVMRGIYDAIEKVEDQMKVVGR